MRAWLVLVVVACTHRAPPPGLGETKTATMMFDDHGSFIGDAIDFASDSVQLLPGDLFAWRDNTYVQGAFETAAFGVVLANVGSVATLADIALPPAAALQTGTVLANLGDGLVVLPTDHCPVAMRVTDETFAPSMSGSGAPIANALKSITIEYAHDTCTQLALDVTIIPAQGTCPPMQMMGGAAPIYATIDGWPRQVVQTSSLALPTDSHVTLDESDPVVWGGDCSGTAACALDTSASHHVTATISPPLRCSPGP